MPTFVFTLALQSFCLSYLKSKEPPRKKQGVSSLPTPEELEKRAKTHKEARKIVKRKKQGEQKKQGLEGQGRSGAFPFGGFELEWSLLVQWRLPWKGFLSLATNEGYQGHVLKE